MANYNATTDILEVAGLRIDTAGGVSTALDSDYVVNIVLELQANAQALIDSESARVDTISRRLDVIEDYRLVDYDSDLRVANANNVTLTAAVTAAQADADSIDLRLIVTDSDVGMTKERVGTSNLTTTATIVIDAINEIDAEIGDITTLTTTDKTGIVAALNEIKAAMDVLTTRMDTAETNIANLQARVGASATPITIDDLSDVNLSVAPTSGQVLKYSGTNWTAQADA
jgi:hypothetical protein